MLPLVQGTDKDRIEKMHYKVPQYFEISLYFSTEVTSTKLPTTPKIDSDTTTLVNSTQKHINYISKYNNNI